MLNLLPEPERKMISEEYRLRRWVVMFIFLALLGLISLIFLAPAYTVASLEKQQLTNNLEDLKLATEDLIEPEVFRGVETVSKSLNLLVPHVEDIFVIDVLEMIVSNRPDRLSITSFAVRKDGNNREISISLSGQADSRDILLSFSEELKKEDCITDINIPLESFTQEENLDFSMQISGEF